MVKADKFIRIMEELLREKDEHGNRRHTITEIAREARVSRATVYRYKALFEEAPNATVLEN